MISFCKTMHLYETSCGHGNHKYSSSAGSLYRISNEPPMIKFTAVCKDSYVIYACGYRTR